MTQISQLYQVRDPEAVAAFVRGRPTLAALLTEAEREIKRVFGADAKLSLELLCYGHVPDQAHLYALVSAPLDVADALRKMDELDAKWWMGNRERGQGDLTLDVEFA